MTADTTDTTPRPKALGPHGLAQQVDCRICSAGTKQPCVGDDGTPRTDPHHSRWMRYQRLVRRQPFVAVALRDIAPGLRAGDPLVCVATDRGAEFDVVGDGLGRRFTTPSTVDASAVDFRAFLDERGGRSAVGRHGRRRAHAEAS